MILKIDEKEIRNAIQGLHDQLKIMQENEKLKTDIGIIYLNETRIPWQLRKLRINK